MGTTRTINLRGKDRSESVKSRQENARKGKKIKAKAKKAKKSRSKEEKAKYYREYRERVKADPVRNALNKKKEQERWARRVASGRIKPVGEMSKREQRISKKRSRESSAKFYRKKKIQQAKEKEPTVQPESLQKQRARKKVKKQMRSTTRKLKSLETKLGKVFFKNLFPYSCFKKLQE